MHTLIVAFLFLFQGHIPVPPNIAVIILDDVGIDQLACYDDVNSYSTAHAYARMPNLDALASEGARFTQCRSAPICSPARAMVNTGRYPFRTGCGSLVATQYVTSSFEELGSPTAEVGFASLFTAGPRKAIGKWHLGIDEGDGGTMPGHPMSLGWSSWSGTLRNLLGAGGELPPGSPGYSNFLWFNGGTGTNITNQHATSYTADRAIDWINARSANPRWLLCLSFNAAHYPYNAADIPPTNEQGFGSSINSSYKNTAYRALLESADFALGRVLAALPSETVVFVLGDNGSPLEAIVPASGEPRYPSGHPSHQAGDDTTQLSSAPYDVNHAKGFTYEQGIRVPLIVSGPGVVSGTREDLVDTVDLFRTICAIRGASVPSGAATDSISFAGALSGTPGSRSWSFSEHYAPNGTGQTRTLELRCYIRASGTHLWKVVRSLGVSDEFYDVSVDPLETSNLGTSHAEYAATAAALDALLGS